MISLGCGSSFVEKSNATDYAVDIVVNYSFYCWSGAYPVAVLYKFFLTNRPEIWYK